MSQLSTFDTQILVFLAFLLGYGVYAWVFRGSLKIEASDFDLKVTKPKRFGSGRHMTFAILDTDIFESENSIDLRQVDKLMDEVQKFINHVVNQYKNKNDW